MCGRGDQWRVLYRFAPGGELETSVNANEENSANCAILGAGHTPDDGDFAEEEKRVS